LLEDISTPLLCGLKKVHKIIDNFLPRGIRVDTNPFKGQWYDYPPQKPYQQAIFEEIKQTFDMKSCVGFEEWSHNPHWSWLPEEHYDKDETLFYKEGIVRTPLCSAVFYLKVSDLAGGDLHLIDEDVLISPRTNRLVLFSPGVLHTVTAYISGERVSLNINPWDYAIKSS